MKESPVILHVFAVYDLGTAAFGKPIFLRADGEAVRMFTDETNRAEEGNIVFQHPEHFQLFKLGTWDDSTGEFNATRPDKIVDGAQVKMRKQ